jgi:uncharacterized membrane-anchored protein YitT (DUF2179 family)
MLKKTFQEWYQDIGFFILGGCLYALSVSVFTLPSNIAPGGATGIATVLNHLFHLPVGLTMLALNLPLFLLSVIFLGRKFLARTIVATALSSLLIDFLGLWIPVYQGNRLLASLYGGVFLGLGLTLIFLRGGTTGGTDIAAKLLIRVFKTASIGQLIMAIDFVIIAFSALIYQDIDSMLYALIVLFTATAIMDRLLYNAGMGKLIYIISDRSHQISDEILKNLQRGVTVLYGKGGYSGKDRQILLCTVRRNEVWRVKQLVKNLDPTAFMVVGDAGQVLGEGFSRLSE